MKKYLLFPVLVVSFGLNLWGADFSLSAGAGGLLGGFFTRYNATGTTAADKMTQKVNQFNYGGLLFFDATYAELAVIIQGGAGNYNEVMRKGDAMAPRDGKGWESTLGFSLLGKYPFTLSERFKLSPLLGIDYQLALLERRRQTGGIVYDRTNGIQEQDKDGKKFPLSTWNSFWINVGAGLDYNITKQIYVRGELLYGFRLMTSYEKDGLEQMKELLNDNNPTLSGLTSGPSLRFAVGYRFWSK